MDLNNISLSTINAPANWEKGKKIATKFLLTPSHREVVEGIVQGRQTRFWMSLNPSPSTSSNRERERNTNLRQWREISRMKDDHLNGIQKSGPWGDTPVIAGSRSIQCGISSMIKSIT